MCLDDVLCTNLNKSSVCLSINRKSFSTNSANETFVNEFFQLFTTKNP